jgi:hypothetical protein
MNRGKILSLAADYVMRDRAAMHGDAERNFETIARYWSIHLGIEISAPDVAILMALLKVARLKSNPGNADNWVDGCGYLACGGEVATTLAEARTGSEERV